MTCSRIKILIQTFYLFRENPVTDRKHFERKIEENTIFELITSLKFVTSFTHC